ncbi:hypothetical protein [Alicyclobacillus acidiphilus]|nr:hypothetical protein [Alicyclobacillus acidiphilus]
MLTSARLFDAWCMCERHVKLGTVSLNGIALSNFHHTIGVSA